MISNIEQIKSAKKKTGQDCGLLWTNLINVIVDGKV